MLEVKKNSPIGNSSISSVFLILCTAILTSPSLWWILNNLQRRGFRICDKPIGSLGLVSKNDTLWMKFKLDIPNIGILNVFDAKYFKIYLIKVLTYFLMFLVSDITSASMNLLLSWAAIEIEDISGGSEMSHWHASLITSSCWPEACSNFVS